jgi:NAD(P)-dependent dehydrogenase (short-subunit alcohol dehydrogenase family)
MGILSDKVAVITGGTRGLGLAIARAYQNEGASVVVASRSENSVKKAVETLGGSATGLAGDVGRFEDMQALADHAVRTFGKIDIWVNNAALSGVFGPTVDIPVDKYEQIVQTNITGTYYGSIIALRHFLPRNSGKLINLLGRGDNEPVPYQNAYAPSKMWVYSFTRALAKEYRKSGIGIYAYNPGLVNTDMLLDVEAIAGYEQRLRIFGTIVRLWAVEPDVAAQTALRIASPATDGKTGLVINAASRRLLLKGVARDVVRRLRREPAPDTTVRVTVMPPWASRS